MTDPIDGAERDPLDLELGIENLVRIAAQYDDEEADARAARCAETLAPTFHEARRLALGSGQFRQRAAAINALEGSARASRCGCGRRSWRRGPAASPSRSRTSKRPGRSSRARSRRSSTSSRIGGGPRPAHRRAISLEVLAIRLGGYALDACGEDSDLGPGRGPTAHDTCLWLRKIEGLQDGARELPAASPER